MSSENIVSFSVVSIFSVEKGIANNLLQASNRRSLMDGALLCGVGTVPLQRFGVERGISCTSIYIKHAKTMALTAIYAAAHICNYRYTYVSK